MADDKSIEEIAAQSKGGLVWSTASYNPYFPYTNVSRYCWASFVEFQRCVNEKGDAENPTCKKYLGAMSGMCPKDWSDGFVSQMENKNMPGQEFFDKSMKKPHHH